MNDILRFLRKVVGDLLKKELRSTAGKVNLVGGIIITALTALLFVHSLALFVINAVLSLVGARHLEAINESYILASILFVVAYFMYCTKIISQAEHDNRR
jgi:hypothetical protein